jgi:pyruvate dehydrogenase E1 component beta subunit
MEHKLIYKIKDNVVLNKIPSSSELLGKANIVSEGNDITVVSYSHMVNVVKDVISSNELSEISIELIDLQTLSPLDMGTITTSVFKTKKLLVCQEAPANSSVGSTVISNVVQSDVFSSLSSAPKLVSGLHSPMPSAKHLETTVIPQKEDIMQAIKDMV